MPCGKDPFWVCRNGLRCLRGVCVRTIARGRSCNIPGSVCAEGLSCVGNLGNKKCFMRKPVGMPCGKDPFWVCRHGLRCIKNVCVRTVNVGQECNSPEALCPEGTSCVGNEGNRKCFAKKEAGMRCGKDPFWVCRNGLRCAGGICKV
ncbi:unnamed protein product [Chondrus crispus]|uniref:Uncharacterized protein n=1 Tax=Chondrus crispus TaxID=2769 RepID=R7QQT1_CHOCR|nr:unnamed protein product [Chondrus crispus]CDF39841.1 unnamed protein product [Chondrus crispus]|eukprot:XP_005710135.1 unnamed protein product [Chondrus crispus]